MRECERQIYSPEDPGNGSQARRIEQRSPARDSSSACAGDGSLRCITLLCPDHWAARRQGRCVGRDARRKVAGRAIRHASLITSRLMVMTAEPGLRRENVRGT